MKSLQLNIFLADFSHLEPLHRAVRDELTVTGDAQPNYGSFRVWFGCRSVLACYKATVACVLRLSCFADRKAKIAKKERYLLKKKRRPFFLPNIYLFPCVLGAFSTSYFDYSHNGCHSGKTQKLPKISFQFCVFDFLEYLFQRRGQIRKFFVSLLG